MANYQRLTDKWLQAVEPWLYGGDGPAGEQLTLPGMPEPPARKLARVLPFLLAYYANGNGGEIRPTRKRLARVANVSERETQRALKELVALGLLIRCGPAYRGRAQAYNVGFPVWLSDRKGDRGVSLSNGKGRPGAPQRETGVSPHHSPKGDGPDADDDAPLAARVATAENDPPPPVTERETKAPDDVPCPVCERPVGLACKAVREGPMRGGDGYHVARRLRAGGLTVVKS